MIEIRNPRNIGNIVMSSYYPIRLQYFIVFIKLKKNDLYIYTPD